MLGANVLQYGRRGVCIVNVARGATPPGTAVAAVMLDFAHA